MVSRILAENLPLLRKNRCFSLCCTPDGKYWDSLFQYMSSQVREHLEFFPQLHLHDSFQMNYLEDSYLQIPSGISYYLKSTGAVNFIGFHCTVRNMDKRGANIIVENVTLNGKEKDFFYCNSKDGFFIEGFSPNGKRLFWTGGLEEDEMTTDEMIKFLEQKIIRLKVPLKLKESHLLVLRNFIEKTGQDFSKLYGPKLHKIEKMKKLIQKYTVSLKKLKEKKAEEKPLFQRFLEEQTVEDRIYYILSFFPSLHMESGKY